MGRFRTYLVDVPAVTAEGLGAFGTLQHGILWGVKGDAIAAIPFRTYMTPRYGPTLIAV